MLKPLSASLVGSLVIQENPQRFWESRPLRTLRPQLCSHCGSQAFAEVPVSVQVQQVAQLVERPIEIVEYQQQSCQCADCGQVHTAAWPESIVPGQDLGVSLQALLVWLGSSAIRKQQELLWELGDINIGVGTLQATNTRVYEAVEPTVTKLREWVQDQPTCMWMKRLASTGVKEWLWVSAEEVLSVSCRGYPLRVVRSTVRFEFDGIISSDDFSVYNGYPAGSQQKCLAHLRRHFKKWPSWVMATTQPWDKLDLIDEALLNIGSGEKPRMRALIKIGQWGSSRG